MALQTTRTCTSPTTAQPVRRPFGEALLRDLTHDFDRLTRDPATRRTLTAWAVLEPDLAYPDLAYPDLGTLAAAAEDRSHPEQGWRIIAALARLASTHGHDEPAAAPVLLQLLLPGAARLIRTLHWLPAEDRAPEYLCELLSTIRGYRCHARSPHTALNLLRDAHKTLRRRAIAQRLDQAEQPLPLDSPAATQHLTSTPAPDTAPTSGEELLHLLTWAASTRVLPADDIELIGRSRLADEDITTLATASGVLPHSLRRRRQRAEQTLATAARKELTLTAA